MLQPETYMTTQEAAKELGLNDSRIRQMLLAGELKGQKFGERPWAIPRTEVERLKQERDSRHTRAS